MFVLSVEGPNWVNRRTWATHKVLGVFPTEDDALAFDRLATMSDDDIVLLTDLDSGKAIRINTGADESDDA